MITTKSFYKELDQVEELLIKKVKAACNIVRETAKEMEDERDDYHYDVPAVVAQYFKNLCEDPGDPNELDLTTFLEEM